MAERCEMMFKRRARFLHSGRSQTWQTLLGLCAFLPLVISVTGCGKLAGGIVNLMPQRVADFKKSQIITNSPGVADGRSELLVAISLQNSDNTPVIDFTPTYEIVSGTGVIPTPCTRSNANGVATCILKANSPGIKRLATTNLPVHLENEIEFTAIPKSLSRLDGLAASGVQTQIEQQYRITASVGEAADSKPRVANGYRVFGSVQGGLNAH